MNNIVNAKIKAQHRFAKRIENLQSFVNKTFNSYKNQNIRFQNQIPDIFHVKASPSQLKTIFENLIENSIKHGFIGDKRNIFVKAQISDHDNFILEYWNDGNVISYEIAESIFSGVKHCGDDSESFHHGMSQVRRYIEEIGGSIECRLTSRTLDNHPELFKPLKQGIPVFRIKLPFYENQGDTNKRILIADDCEDDRNMMREILEEGGYEVVEADSIDAALRVTENEQIYGAVLDVHFGEERDGIWLLKKVQRIKKEVKIIVVSGSDGSRKDAWRVDANNNGALATFDKLEYDPDQILNVF